MLLLLLLPTVAGYGLSITDEQYYKLPPLFSLDDYQPCLASPGGQYCLGSFHLTAEGDNHLYDVLLELTNDLKNFNHTLLHRGYCLTTRCLDIEGSLPQRFTACVDRTLSQEYGLRATLDRLDYCKTGDKPRTRPIDNVDWIFAAVAIVVLVLNGIGTLYDTFRNQDEKPNRFLIIWSFYSNWNRLTANYEDGDDRLSALNPIQGVKALTLLLVMMAHTTFSYYTGYTYNPLFLETHGRNPLSYFFYNGSVIVQTFVIVSSFLLSYNLLLHVDKNPKKILGLSMLPRSLMHRLSRIVPLYLFVLGLASTWWSHANDGALWTPLVEAEVARCRHKFWTQALFINNLYEPNTLCLIQTWFLAVDMQLYVVAAVLTLLLGRWPRLALKLFGAMFLASVAGIFAISYKWSLFSILYSMTPEVIRMQLTNQDSFNYLYTAPWGSLPASLMGLFLAFLHYDLEKRGFKANEHRWLVIAYRLSVPSMFLWVFAGSLFQQFTSPEAKAIFTALDRPVFVVLVSTALFGFCNKIDELWWKFLSWRGFMILGRMSLSVLLFHWSYNLSIMGGRLIAAQASVLEIGGDWMAVIFLTYVTAVPATLLVEYPLQRTLQAVFG